MSEAPTGRRAGVSHKARRQGARLETKAEQEAHVAGAYLAV